MITWGLDYCRLRLIWYILGPWTTDSPVVRVVLRFGKADIFLSLRLTVIL